MLKAVSVLVVTLWAAVAGAQTPQQQPLVQPGDVSYVGVWTVPGYASLEYTSHGLLAVDNGRGLYACNGSPRPQSLAVITIPPVGGVAKVLVPCTPIANIEAVSSDPNRKLIAGGLFWQGRVKASVYAYYDGGGNATASHFDMSETLTGQAGPVRVGTENPGLIGGYMGVIPQEWRPLLGGPAFTGASALPIINRSCLGPCFSVFNPADVGTVNPVPSKMLIGYPYAHPTLGRWEDASQYFTGADRWGGMAFPGGTRSIISVSSHGQPVPPVGCYGYGTLDKTLVGTYAPDGVLYCYDSDPNKGPKAYPRAAWMMAYDANDLLAVKAGTKQPWDMVPYAAWNFGVGSPLENKQGIAIVGATFDQASSLLYVSTGSTEVFVFKIGTGAPPPPPPIDCQGVWSESLSEPTPLVCDATQVQTRIRTKTFTVTTPASNGGLACPASPVVTTETSSCVWDAPPPPPPPQFVGSIRAQATGSYGLRLTLEVHKSQTIPAKGAKVDVPLPAGVTVHGTVYSISTYANGNWRVTVTLPATSAITLAVQVP